MGGGELEDTGRAAPGAGGPSRGQHVPVAGDDPGLRVGGANGGAGGQVGHSPRPGEEPVERRLQAGALGGARLDGDKAPSGHGPLHRRLGHLSRVPRAPAGGPRLGDDEPDRPGLGPAGVLQGAKGSSLVGRQGSGGQVAEQGGDGVLPALLNAQMLGQRPEQALQPGLGELGRGVLRPQGQGEGVAARRPGGLLRCRLGAGLGGGGEGVARGGEGRRRRLMTGSGLGLLRTGAPGVLVAVVSPVSASLGGTSSGRGLLQGGLGGGLALLGRGQGSAGLLAGSGGGLMAGAGRGQAAARARHLLPVLGLAALQRGERALGGVLGGLGLHPLLGGGGQGAAGGLDPLGELGLLGGRGLGAPVQFLGVGAEGRLGGVRQAPHALGGDVGEGGELLGGAGEALPHLGGGGEPAPGARLDLGEPGQAVAGGLLGLLGGGAARGDGGGVLLTGLEELLGGDDVVGEQAGGGVADLDLDGAGAAGDGGLLGQGTELAVELVGEVGDAREVGGHGVELAQGSLLAAAVLEDTGGLLDEASAILRGGGQDGVELALADDDVHLAAQARVGQELLDVEEAALGAVDLVLRSAAPEEGAGDGDLGVVDGQGAIGVIDGQGDLGAPEGGPRPGAGEDDVGHRAATQVLRALLAHDPGQGVHDIGLARAVGADDGGDARLQAQRGRRGEGLEALDRQRLEVHGPTIPSAPGPQPNSRLWQASAAPGPLGEDSLSPLPCPRRAGGRGSSRARSGRPRNPR